MRRLRMRSEMPVGRRGRKAGEGGELLDPHQPLEFYQNLDRTYLSPTPSTQDAQAKEPKKAFV